MEAQVKDQVAGVAAIFDKMPNEGYAKEEKPHSVAQRLANVPSSDLGME